MFAIYKKVTRGSLIMNFLYLYYIFYNSGCFISFLLSSYYSFKPSNYIINTIITIMFINITITGILEKSSGGEFQARNSSDIVVTLSDE